MRLISRAAAGRAGANKQRLMAKNITDAEFEKEVLKSPVPVLVDFWAPWCGPCQKLVPVIDALAKEIPDAKFRIRKVNVDENSAVPGQYGIMSIPTLMFFKFGQPVEQLVGMQVKDKLKEKIEEMME